MSTGTSKSLKWHLRYWRILTLVLKHSFSVSLRIHSAQLCTEACWPEISWGWKAGGNHWADELQSPRSGEKSLAASFSFVIPFTNVNACKFYSILFTCHTSFSLYRKVMKHFLMQVNHIHLSCKPTRGTFKGKSKLWHYQSIFSAMWKERKELLSLNKI